ncbi:MAG: hypothetical protein AAFU77_15430, partial [Myxococcota bacterium]
MLRALFLLLVATTACSGSEELTSRGEDPVGTEDPVVSPPTPAPSGGGDPVDEPDPDGRVTPDEVCLNGEFDRGQESAIDCGGICPPCDRGQTCLFDMDCKDGLWCGLDDGICDPIACENGVQDGLETSVDCGGSECATRCSYLLADEGRDGCREDDGAGGFVDGDENCRDEFDALTECVDGFCAPPTCDDAHINGGESDLNCGGPCPERCSLGQVCFDDNDCEGDYTEWEGGFVMAGIASDGMPPPVEACNFAFLSVGECISSLTLTFEAFDLSCDGACSQAVTAGSGECRRVTEDQPCTEVPVGETLTSPSGVDDGISCGYLATCDNKERRVVYLLNPLCRSDVCVAVDYQSAEPAVLDCEASNSRDQSTVTCEAPILDECVNNSGNQCSFGNRAVTRFACDGDEACVPGAAQEACDESDYQPGDIQLRGRCGDNFCRMSATCTNQAGAGGGGPGGSCVVSTADREIEEFRRVCEGGGCT